MRLWRERTRVTAGRDTADVTASLQTSTIQERGRASDARQRGMVVRAGRSRVSRSHGPARRWVSERMPLQMQAQALPCPTWEPKLPTPPHRPPPCLSLCPLPTASMKLYPGHSFSECKLWLPLNPSFNKELPAPAPESPASGQHSNWGSDAIDTWTWERSGHFGALPFPSVTCFPGPVWQASPCKGTQPTVFALRVSSPKLPTRDHR